MSGRRMLKVLLDGFKPGPPGEMGKSRWMMNSTWWKIRKSHLLLLAICCGGFAGSTLLLATYGGMAGGPRTVNLILSGTRVKIDSLTKNFNAAEEEEDRGRMRVNSIFFKLLGLPLNPEDVLDVEQKPNQGSKMAALWPHSFWRKAGNASEPVIVALIRSGQAGDAVHFLRNCRSFLPDSTVVLFNMGLSTHELKLVQSYCDSSAGSNRLQRSSTASCMVVLPDLSFLPSHVRKSSTDAFRPIAIQTVLKDAGSVLFMRINQRLTTGNLTRYLNFAKRHYGVAAWQPKENRPTTSLTHPNMFKRFQVERWIGDYKFQHMVSMDALVIYNTEKVREELMVPWIKCALTADCIEPVGAQDTGCRFDKKPRFRYSGCHAYDISAINIVLGQMFGFDESRYILDREDKFFKGTFKEGDSADAGWIGHVATVTVDA